MCDRALGDDLSNLTPWIERCVGVLEDHLQVLAVGSQSFTLKTGYIEIIEVYVSAVQIQ